MVDACSMAQITMHQAHPVRPASRAETAARVLLVPLGVFTTIGAVKFAGFTAFGIILVTAAVIYLATAIFGHRVPALRMASLGVAPLHFLFSLTKLVSGETFSATFLVVTAAVTVLLAISLRRPAGAVA